MMFFDREQKPSNIIQHDFFLLFSFFLNFETSQKCIQHFIQHQKFTMLDEMLDSFAPAFRIYVCDSWI